MQRIPFNKAALDYQGHGGQKPINGERLLMLLSPPMLEGIGRLGFAVLTGAKLDAQLRELAILRNAHLSNCAYSFFHHSAVASRAGLTAEKIAAVKGSLDAPLWSRAECAVLKFTDDIILNVRASDATLNELRAVMSDTEVMELIVSVGSYMTLVRLIETAGIEIDVEPIAAGPVG